MCNFLDDDTHMMLCNFCNTGIHTYCPDPALVKLPLAKLLWFCLHCLATGATFLQLKDVVRGQGTSRTAAPLQRHLTSCGDRSTRLLTNMYCFGAICLVTQVYGGQEIVRSGLLPSPIFWYQKRY